MLLCCLHLGLDLLLASSMIFSVTSFASLSNLQFAGYAGEKSPVKGAWFEKGKSSFSMSYVGRQFNVANKRLQAGK